MKLSELSVRHGITTLMAYIVAVGFGIFSLTRLGLDMYPDISFPMVGIVAMYEGAAPEDVEQIVTRPIEESAASVKGVTEIVSTSKHGASVVMVKFDWGYDIDKGERDLRKSIDLFAKDRLPAEVTTPITFAFDPAMQPILLVSVTGDMDQAHLRRIAVDDIEPRLERVDGVATVETMGGLEREIQVRVDPERLRAYRLTVQQVIDTLRRENVQIPAGTVMRGEQEFGILTHGRFRNVEEIRGVVIGYRQAGMFEGPSGQALPTPAARAVPIRLRDVAEVEDTFRETQRIVRAEGEPAVFLVVFKQSGYNSVRACRAAAEALPGIERALGGRVRLREFFDQSEFIELALGNLTGTAYKALALTALVLLLFLQSLRGSLVIAVSVPVSVIVTFAVMDQIGLTLNILSMAGLALAIGMLVDNSIVVLENITRHVEGGKDAREAAIVGAREVSMAVSASTLTTIVVFAPIPFVPGIAGMLFRDTAITIVVSLTASLIVALTLVPLLASWMLGREVGVLQRRWYRRRLGAGIDLLRAGYVRALAGTLRFRKTTLAVVLGILGGSIALAAREPAFEFFPKTDMGMAIFEVTAATGSPVERTDSYVRDLERLAREVPETAFVLSDVGIGDQFTALFGEGAHSGLLRVKLRPLAERTRYQKEIERDLVERFRRVAGVEATAFRFAMFGAGADIAVDLYGDDIGLLRKVGLDLKRAIEAVPGTADVGFTMEEGRPEFRVRLDRERMAALGVPTLAVTHTIQAYFQGVLATLFREGGQEYRVLVRAPRERRLDERELELLPVPTLTGKQVPLSDVAQVVPALGPVSVTRKDQRRLATVHVTVPGRDLGGVVAAVEKVLAGYRFPPDFGYYVGGTAEDLRETQRYMSIALLVAVLLVYMVMASQFESLLEPFIIFFTIPLAIIGVALTLSLTGMSISVPAIIGVVILFGIAVNNGIVLVDRANQSHRDGGLPLREAVLEAGRLRFRPVLMTACTTILGMVPLALEIGEGSESWAPLGKVIIGGLSVSTVLTLFVVPILYMMIVGLVERIRERGLIGWLLRRERRGTEGADDGSVDGTSPPV